ncbi:MAG: hypothetical protein ABIQ01_01340 [Pseudolysinimonas sp.]
MSQTPEVTTPSQPTENVPRGTLMALLIIPAGIIAWVILWQFGLVASIVAFGVAIGALWLYRFGSGGRVSRTGAIRVTIITIVTLLLSFLAGLVADVVPMYANQRNLDVVTALTSGEFWSFFNHALANNIGNVAVPLLLALVFGALGCFSVLRTAFVQTRAVTMPPVDGTAPSIPAPEADPNADKRD